MKKIFKVIALFILIITCCFLITGCGNKEKKDVKPTSFEVTQVDDGTIQYEFTSLKAGEEKSGTVLLEKGNDLVVDYKLLQENLVDEGAKSLTLTVYRIVDGKRQEVSSEMILGEGKSTTSELEEGTYELVLKADVDGPSGTVKVFAK